MALRRQSKLPQIPPMCPSNKENLEEPGDKRRKIGGGKMVVPKAKQALAAVNGGSNRDEPGAGSETGSVAAGFEFKTRADVDALLNEKMKGKSKMDFKGKSEQMMEYIKKLRSCIRWYMEVEDGHLQEQERLREMVEIEQKKLFEMEVQMLNEKDKLTAELEKLRLEFALLLEKFKKEEAAKVAVIESCKTEKEAKENAEKSNIALSEVLNKATQEALHSHQQIETLQDINKKLQEYNSGLQAYNSRLQDEATKHTEINNKLQQEKTSMLEQLSKLRAKSDLLQEQLSALRVSHQETLNEKEEHKSNVDCLRSELHEVKDDRNLQLAKVKSLSADVEKLREKTTTYSLQLDEFFNTVKTLEESCSTKQEEIQQLTKKLGIANTKLQMADSTTLETKTEYVEQSKLVKELQLRLADAESKITDGERLRKKLHNTILELKGNIRVFCRVRPILQEQGQSVSKAEVVSYPASLDSPGEGITLMHSGKPHPFTFDKVFKHDATQESVFVEISQLVQSALDGYKVCIFAYGQTGSGKTYTMMGRPEERHMKGLIPRSVEQIFEASQSLLSQGWKYTMQASMLEIYNETIRDLLIPNRSNGLDANTSLAKQYTIKHDQSGNTHVSDLTIVDVCSTREVSYLLQQAAQSRSVGRTQMNEHSSRSHFVFMLRISGVNESTDQHVQGVLNLIDLAGSERLDKSGATGDRLKETQHINKSLLSLSEVISAIAKKDEHIPFRNSKLTYLLQPCLGGESKTLMVVNISPDPTSSSESKCSLQFAAKVNSCEIGVARRQTSTR